MRNNFPHSFSEFSLQNQYLEGGMKAPNRRIRTRLYFTSESHIHSLFNTLRFQSTNSKHQGGFMDDKAVEDVGNVPEHDYLTHIVLKLYENKLFPLSDPNRFRIELVRIIMSNFDIQFRWRQTGNAFK